MLCISLHLCTGAYRLSLASEPHLPHPRRRAQMTICSHFSVCAHCANAWYFSRTRGGDAWLRTFRWSNWWVPLGGALSGQREPRAGAAGSAEPAASAREALGLRRPYNDPGLRSRKMRSSLYRELFDRDMIEYQLSDGVRVGLFARLPSRSLTLSRAFLGRWLLRWPTPSTWWTSEASWRSAESPWTVGGPSART